MNRLLLDQGLPRSAVRHLEKRGFDVRHVADIGHRRSSDAEITALALDQSRVIMTLEPLAKLFCGTEEPMSYSQLTAVRH